MATLRQAVLSMLEYDGVLSTLLTGGVFQADDIDQLDAGGYEWVPKEPDSVRVQPFALIRWKASTPLQAEFVSLAAERQALEIYLYADIGGYALIDQAATRIKFLLHNTYLEAEDRQIAHSTFSFLSGEIPAEELGGLPMKFVRFHVNYIR
jgi:hypothetical protein